MPAMAMRSGSDYSVQQADRNQLTHTGGIFAMDAPGHRQTATDRQRVMDGLIRRTMAVNRHEMRALGWAFSYFFALLCSYYIIRPMRDEMGIAGGVEHLQWMFSGTFLAMLAVVPFFGWVTR